MDPQQLLQRKALLERKRELLLKKQQLGGQTKPSISDNVESGISNRGSFIDVNKPINPLDMTVFGGKKMVPETLRAIGGGLEVAEGVPASIGLDLQRAVKTGGKSITDIPSNLGKVFTGQRPAQFGDIFRGAGVPEPIAATGGLLASAHPATPSSGIGNLIGKAIGKPISAGFKAVKPALSKTMSFMSGTPSKSISRALDKPEILSNRYIKKAGKTAGEALEREKEPLIQDPTAMVKPTPQMASIGDDLKWYTKTGDETAQLSKLGSGERDKVLDWATRIDNGRGGVNFNEADKVIAEIDSALGTFYDKKSRLQIPPISKPFQFQAQHIRGVIDKARKTQFPKAGKAIEDYAEFAGDRSAHRDFQRVKPLLREGLGGGLGGVGIGFLLKSLPLGLAGFSLTSPAVQGQLIKAGAGVAKNIASAPSATPMLMKELFRKRKKK